MIFVFFLMLFFLFLSCLIFWLGKFYYKNKPYSLTPKKGNPSICIIIPARDESNVIEELLQSIQVQTYTGPKDVFIIVEDSKDPTVQIAETYHANVFVRKDFRVRTKGYAIKELIEDLESRKQYYDLYFIFDADNILDRDYLVNMLKEYHAGYEISTGYRALKNPNHPIALSSWLTFLLVNEFRNGKALKTNSAMLFSGTGFYFTKKLICKWKTFPFHSLTEDYECSYYACLENISTHYTRAAIFYDEQPTTYQATITQRSRWIKGYFTNYFHNFATAIHKLTSSKTPNKGSIFFFLTGVFGPILYGITIFFLCLWAILVASMIHPLLAITFTILFFLLLYFLLVFMTVSLITHKQDELQISSSLIWKTSFYYPIFLLSFVHAFFKMLFSKHLTWDKIEHHNKKS